MISSKSSGKSVGAGTEDEDGVAIESESGDGEEEKGEASRSEGKGTGTRSGDEARLGRIRSVRSVSPSGTAALISTSISSFVAISRRERAEGEAGLI